MASTNRVVQLFERKKPDGSPLYRPEDVVHFLPLVVLMGAPDSLDQLPATLEQIMRDFSGKLGLPPKAGPDVIQKAIEAYYAKHPVDPQLANDFRELVRLVTDGAADKLDTARAAAALHTYQERHVPIPQKGNLWGSDEPEKK
jgi:hypothetical protein